MKKKKSSSKKEKKDLLKEWEEKKERKEIEDNKKRLNEIIEERAGYESQQSSRIWWFVPVEFAVFAYHVILVGESDVEDLCRYIFGFGMSLDYIGLTCLRLLTIFVTFKHDKVLYGKLCTLMAMVFTNIKFLQVLFSDAWLDLNFWKPMATAFVLLFSELYYSHTYDDARLTRVRCQRDLTDREALKDFRTDDQDGGTTRLELSRKILRFMIPYKLDIFFMGLTLTCGYGLRCINPWVMSKIMDGIADGGVGHLVALYFFNGWLETMVFTYLQSIYTHRIEYQLMRDMKHHLFEAILHLEIGYFDENSTGELTSAIDRHMTRVSTRLIWITRMFGEAFITFFFVFLFSLQLNARLTIACLSCHPIILWWSTIFGKMAYEVAIVTGRVGGKVGKHATEVISNIRLVKQFHTENYESNQYYSFIDAWTQNVNNNGKMHSLNWSSFFFFPRMADGICLLCGGILIRQGQCTIGNLTAFLTYSNLIAWMTGLCGREYVTGIRVLGNAHKVFSILDRGSKLEFTKEIKMKKCRGELEFRDLVFSYPKTPDEIVLDKMNLKVQPGQNIALVGESGGGKSTVVKVFMHLYGANSGEVLIDGVPIHKYDPETLYKFMTIVPQDPVLFARSIRDNICYGMKKGTFDEEDIIRAAKMANAHEFIMKLPEGYDSEVGERGVTLSGGQKQRVSIARALIRRPKILFLDEATAALDSESENLVQKAIENVMKEECITMIAIAHRLSTVKNADTIHVVVGGKIVESGTHEKLMENEDGEYMKLIRRQMLTTKKKDDEDEKDDDDEEETSEMIFAEDNEDNLLQEPLLARQMSKHFSAESIASSTQVED